MNLLESTVHVLRLVHQSVLLCNLPKRSSERGGWLSLFPAFVVSTTQKRHLAEEKLKTEAQLQTPLSRVCLSVYLKNNCQCFGSVAVAISFPAQVNDLMDACRHNHLESISNFNAFKIYKQDPQVVQRSESAHVRKAYHFFFGEDA